MNFSFQKKEKEKKNYQFSRPISQKIESYRFIYISGKEQGNDCKGQCLDFFLSSGKELNCKVLPRFILVHAKLI